MLIKQTQIFVIIPWFLKSSSRCRRSSKLFERSAFFPNKSNVAKVWNFCDFAGWDDLLCSNLSTSLLVAAETRKTGKGRRAGSCSVERVVWFSWEKVVELCELQLKLFNFYCFILYHSIFYLGHDSLWSLIY